MFNQLTTTLASSLHTVIRVTVKQFWDTAEWQGETLFMWDSLGWSSGRGWPVKRALSVP